MDLLYKINKKNYLNDFNYNELFLNELKNNKNLYKIFKLMLFSRLNIKYNINNFIKNNDEILNLYYDYYNYESNIFDFDKNVKYYEESNQKIKNKLDDENINDKKTIINLLFIFLKTNKKIEFFSNEKINELIKNLNNKNIHIHYQKILFLNI